MGTTRDVTTTEQFQRDTPGNRYNAAVYELLASNLGQEFSVREIVKRLNPEDFGTRATSAIASVSTRWLGALPGDPWLHIHRRAEERSFYYRWEPEARPPVHDKPMATLKRDSLRGKTAPKRARGWKKGVTPVAAPPNELEWAEAHRDDPDDTARKVARDILKAHQLATQPEPKPRSNIPMSHRLKLTLMYLGKGERAEHDRLRKRAYRLRERGLDDDAIAEVLPAIQKWDLGRWRVWINADELDLDAVFPPAPPEEPLLDKVDHLREIVGVEPNGIEPEPVVEEPQLAFLPEAEVKYLPELEVVAHEVVEPHEGFNLGERVEVIGFTRDGEAIVRDTEGTIYKIVGM